MDRIDRIASALFWGAVAMALMLVVWSFQEALMSAVPTDKWETAMWLGLAGLGTVLLYIGVRRLLLVEPKAPSARPVAHKPRIEEARPLSPVIVAPARLEPQSEVANRNAAPAAQVQAALTQARMPRHRLARLRRIASKI